VPFLKNLIFPTLILLSVFSLANDKPKSVSNIDKADTLSVRTDFNKYFEACNGEGCMVILDNNQKKWVVSDSVLCKTQHLPASTFKIINLLIALETGVIKDENELFHWSGEMDTVKYGFRPETYRDMTVKEAFEISVVWVFIKLAQRIGRERYIYYLDACNYGNRNLTEPGIDFWNFGQFGISPVNQVNFIRNMYEEKLPFSNRNIEIVKRVMKTEQNANYTIFAKTGWTREGGINTGWWTGYVETKQGVWFFSTLLLQDRKYNSPTFGPCRKEITKSVFRELKIIEN
jgi:beta-lactamase class D